MATVLHPGGFSPTRQVPADITRPEYVGRKHPRTGEPDVKTPEIIERMRVAGKLAAQALEAVGAAVRRALRRPRSGRPRLPGQPRRLPQHAPLPRLPEVAVHFAERG